MSTFIQYEGDGITTTYQVPFPYLDKAHVRVYLNGVPLPAGAHYEWVGDSTIMFRPWSVPKPNSVIEIRRETPTSALVQFQNGAVLTKTDLNTAVLQALYGIEEIRDKYEARLEAGLSRLANGNFTNAEELINAITQEILSSELLSELQSRIADIDFNAESILQQTVRVNELEAIVNSLSQINGEGITTFILNERNERIAGDEALASDLSLIGARSPDGLSWILNQDTVKVSPTESLAARLSSLAARDDQNTAAITAEQEARIDADSALASDLNALAAQVTNNYNTLTAAISNEQTARADGDAANAAAITNLAATVTNNYNTLNAAISNEASVRASEDSALASSISTLQTTVNGHTASIQTLQSVQDGLKAQWMVKTDVNGRVAGIGLYNTGATSDFIVLADKFAVVHPSANGGNPIVPFAVSGGRVYMRDIVVQDALIESLTVGKLTSGALTATITQNADIHVGTGRIIFDNGVVQLIEGVGFGSSNQFLLWFGPKQPSISQCSEANATFYLKTNGQAYFGGSITTGTLTNQITTSSLSATAEVTLGPFGTNGNPITVLCSYSGIMQGSVPGNSAGQEFTNSGELRLYRTIGTGSEELVAIIPLSGKCQHLIYEPEKGTTVVASSLGGSATFTDSAGGTQNRTFRAQLVSRSMHHGPTQQRISIIATEN